MSGTNPFRRKDNSEASQSQPNAGIAGADPVDRAGIPFPPIDTGVPRSTKTKTVRIISPHYSRSQDGHGISAITSPPPQGFNAPSPVDFDSPSSEEPSPVDPFSVQSDEGTSADDDEDLRRNTIANAASVAKQNPVNLRLPTNPSRKAPALQFGGDATTVGSRDDGRTASAQSAGKPHYDVDDFKRLLLTGEKLRTDKPGSTRPPAQLQGLQRGDSSSNTDASSVSRQSIFESHQTVYQESPRTSMDMDPSDDERHGLVQPSTAHPGRSKPSVPLSRHGKLVKQNVPQTVFFESMSSSPPDQGSTPKPFTELSSPTSPRSIRALNKPLPPPPRSESPIPIEATQDMPPPASHQVETSLTAPYHPSRLAIKRSPPTPPAARRHGQGRSRSSTNDSSRSTSISEEHSQQTHPSPSTSLSTTASRPPPLPPPRNAGTIPAQETSKLTSNVGPVPEALDPAPSKYRPPPPPSRTASTASIKRMPRIRTGSGSSGSAPPPPPRRRGSSLSQSNTTPSRMTGDDENARNQRSANVDGVTANQQSPMPESQAAGKDLVADLTALQREVDEFRGQFDR
ncbi:MAG: hypothetical protein Q9201_004729 [Fulgogasparrea decipioides]